jgi:hypothetical protein
MATQAGKQKGQMVRQVQAPCKIGSLPGMQVIMPGQLMLRQAFILAS